MTSGDFWQQAAVRQLEAVLLRDRRVVGAIVFGSAAESTTGLPPESDLDLLVVEQDDPEANNPERWIRVLGDIFAKEEHKDGWGVLSRVYLSDGRKVDMRTTTVDGLAHGEEWGAQRLLKRHRILFSNDPRIEAEIERLKTLGDVEWESLDFELMIPRFWFKAAESLNKTLKGDELIASHLLLDLYRDCLHLLMLLRDRAAGSTHHKSTGEAAPFLARLRLPERINRASLLEALRHVTIAFDKLAREWSDEDEYEERSTTFHAWIDSLS